jgi:probable phosphoglycerate mutase
MSADRSPAPERVLLVRHAATEWSVAGRHTGRTDLPLMPVGRQAAVRIARRLEGQSFELVLTSPLRRARETCELSGLGREAKSIADLAEWDYGEYEGLTSAEIAQRHPGWSLWRDGCPGGESPSEVGARADAVIALLCGLHGAAAVFAHGHILRVLAARWVQAEPQFGARLMLGTATLSTLCAEHGTRAISSWNDGC